MDDSIGDELLNEGRLGEGGQRPAEGVTAHRGHHVRPGALLLASRLHAHHVQGGVAAGSHLSVDQRLVEDAVAVEVRQVGQRNFVVCREGREREGLFMLWFIVVVVCLLFCCKHLPEQFICWRYIAGGSAMP